MNRHRRTSAAWGAVLVIAVACGRKKAGAPALSQDEPADHAITTTRRANLTLEHPERVPRHGVYASLSGLSATGPIQYWVAIDTDAATVTQPAKPELGAVETMQRALRPDEAAAFRDVLAPLRHASPPPSNPACSDIVDIVVIADGDAVAAATSNCPLDESSWGALRKLAWSMTVWPDGSKP